MGQQESRTGSPALTKRAAELRGAPTASGPGMSTGDGTASTSSRTGRRMEKLFRRAQSTLNPRARERLFSASGGQEVGQQHDSDLQSSGSSLEGTPRGSPAAAHTGAMAAARPTQPSRSSAPPGSLNGCRDRRSTGSSHGSQGSLSGNGLAGQGALTGRSNEDSSDGTPPPDQGTSTRPISRGSLGRGDTPEVKMKTHYTNGSSGERGTVIGVVGKKGPAPAPPAPGQSPRTSVPSTAATRISVQKITPVTIPSLAVPTTRPTEGSSLQQQPQQLHQQHHHHHHQPHHHHHLSPESHKDEDETDGDYVRLKDLERPSGARERTTSASSAGASVGSPCSGEDLTPTKERLADGMFTVGSGSSSPLMKHSGRGGDGLSREQIVRESHPIYSRKSGSKTSSASSLTSVSSASDYGELTMEDVKVEITRQPAPWTSACAPPGIFSGQTLYDERPVLNGSLLPGKDAVGNKSSSSEESTTKEENPDLARLEQSIREGMRAVIGLQQLNSQREAELKLMRASAERNFMGDNAQHALVISSDASSLVSSPCDDVFMDAVNGIKSPATPSESPYMSATEGHGNSRHASDATSPESPEYPENRQVTRKKARRRSKTEPSEACTFQPVDKSVSMENITSDGSQSTRTPHKTIDAAYSVKTSRILASTSQDLVRQRHFSLTGYETPLDIQSRSPFSKRKKTNSDMDLLNTAVDKSYDVPEAQAPLGPKHSMSMPSGLDQQHEIVTKIEEVRMDFAKTLCLRDSERLQGESSTDRMTVSDIGAHMFSAQSSGGEYQTWGGHRRRSIGVSGERTSRPPLPALPSKFKKRPRYAGEVWSSPASPTEVSAPFDQLPGFRRPPSRSISLDEAITTPPSVPEKLDFRQLEKFEGKVGRLFHLLFFPMWAIPSV